MINTDKFLFLKAVMDDLRSYGAKLLLIKHLGNHKVIVGYTIRAKLRDGRLWEICDIEK